MALLKYHELLLKYQSPSTFDLYPNKGCPELLELAILILSQSLISLDFKNHFFYTLQ